MPPKRKRDHLLARNVDADDGQAVLVAAAMAAWMRATLASW